LSQIRPLRRRTTLASFIGRLLGDLGVAHPMQRHLSQEHRDAAPAFAGQPLPNRRRQIAHRGIRANAPTRTALETRFSVIRRAPSNYERQCQWDIEPNFRDTKDLRFGMGMSALRIANPERRDRLFLLNAFAIVLLTLLGAAGESLGMDRLLKVNTSKRRTHSLFRQGCLLYDLIPNMPEHRLRPLIDKFIGYISENSALALALSCA
jgi:hypothetical protein